MEKTVPIKGIDPIGFYKFSFVNIFKPISQHWKIIYTWTNAWVAFVYNISYVDGGHLTFSANSKIMWIMWRLESGEYNG